MSEHTLPWKRFITGQFQNFVTRFFYSLGYFVLDAENARGKYKGRLTE